MNVAWQCFHNRGKGIQRIPLANLLTLYIYNSVLLYIFDPDYTSLTSIASLLPSSLWNYSTNRMSYTKSGKYLQKRWIFCGLRYPWKPGEMFMTLVPANQFFLLFSFQFINTAWLMGILISHGIRIFNALHLLFFSWWNYYRVADFISLVSWPHFEFISVNIQHIFVFAAGHYAQSLIHHTVSIGCAKAVKHGLRNIAIHSSSL